MKKNLDLLLGFSLLILSLVIWNEVRSLGWLNWDDPEYVLHNPWLGNFTQSFQVYYMGNYHPLTLLSLGIDKLIWANYPTGWHTSNWILHSLNTFLLFFLARQIGASKLSAFFVALVWTSLPVLTEAIAWVSSRKDLLYSFFALLSLLAYSKFVQTPSKYKLIYYSASLFFFIAACLSKAMAVMIPVWIILLFYRQEIVSKDFKKILIALSPFLLISLITGILAVLAQQEAEAVQRSLGLIQQPALAIISIQQLLQHIFIPFRLSPFYPYPNEDYFWTQTLISIGILACLGALAYRLNKYYPNLLLGLIVFTILVLPVSQIIPVGIALTADRYAYLASAGLLLTLVPGLFSLSPKPIWVALPLGLWAFFGISRIQQQIPVWKSGISVFKSVVEIHPQTAFAWSNLGNAYAERGDLVQAENAFRKSLKADSSYWIGYQNLSTLLYEKQAYAECASVTQKLLARNPGHLNGQLMQSRLSCLSGCSPDALKTLSSLILENPTWGEAWALIGEHYQYHKQFPSAEIAFRMAVLGNPENENFRINHALMQAESGDAGSAIITLQKLSLSRPQDPILLANLAWIQYLNNQAALACKTNQEALHLAPQIPALWGNQGLYEWTAGNSKASDAAYQKMKSLNPDSATLNQAEVDLMTAKLKAKLNRLN